MSKGKRDYRLTGPDAKKAVEMGLASAEWYHTDIPRKTMKELMKRSDGPAIRDTILWIGSMILFGGIAAWLWPSLLVDPVFPGLWRALRIGVGFALA
jgi:fatty acid desaturase